jgi:hypothetical protein
MGANDVPASAALSQALLLKIEDTTSTPQTVYSSTLAGLGSLDLGIFTAGMQRSYLFTLTFPAWSAVPELQNASTSANLLFTAVAQ